VNTEAMVTELEAMLSGSTLTASERLSAMTTLTALRSQKQPEGLISSNGMPMPAASPATEQTVSAGAPAVMRNALGEPVAGDTPVQDMPKTARGRAELRMGRRSRP